jgi:AraC family transcriptional regulator of adaptative response / DNA-3-methyladenine glycosylase II
MELNHDICYRALQTHDARFDGQFFTAVRTTRIYCRPTCPAPTPKRENCTFYGCAAAAQEAGFRPCLRCRPELAPDLFTSLGPIGVVSRALRLIAAGALDESSVTALAQRLGVAERHLRRLCVAHLGASPVAIAQTRRILFAKQLIDETELPLAEVALAAGFNSVRRFNTVMQTTYGRPPRELRRAHDEPRRYDRATAIMLKLPFSPPYNWDAMAGFLARRAIPGVEAVHDGAYRRTIALDGLHGAVEVRPVAGQNYLMATIRFPRVAALARIVERLRRVFDLGADAGTIAADLRCDPLLAGLVDAWPGLRVPGAWEPFELAVRAILGQQVSVGAARTLVERLVEAYGAPLDMRDTAAALPELRRVFPGPEALAQADLSRLGVPRARAASINALAAEVVREPRLLHDFRDLDDAVRRLCDLPGIGPWTAQYIAMRGLGEPDAFPATDLGLVRATARLAPEMNSRRLAEIAEAWRPWRAYAAMYLWQSIS